METIGNGANDEKLAAEAMGRIAPDLLKVSREELTQVNLDLQEATGTILGVMPEVLALRERIVKELPAFDISYLDKLEDYTLALRFAQRFAMALLRGPMTRKEIRAARGVKEEAAAPADRGGNEKKPAGSEPWTGSGVPDAVPTT
jgi:hypothetical protein